MIGIKSDIAIEEKKIWFLKEKKGVWESCLGKEKQETDHEFAFQNIDKWKPRDGSVHK